MTFVASARSRRTIRRTGSASDSSSTPRIAATTSAIDAGLDDDPHPELLARHRVEHRLRDAQSGPDPQRDADEGEQQVLQT